MAAANVVEVLVTSSNQAGAGLDEAKAGAESAAASMDEYAAATEQAAAAEAEFRAAQADVADALAKQEELQQSGSASADELAAAQDRVTAATLASIDAQTRLAEADARVTEAQQLQGDTAEESAAKTDTAGDAGLLAGGKVKMAMLGVAVGMGLAVKGAMSFQQQTTRLVTSAGESAKALGMVQQGLLALSPATNQSIPALTSGMYMVESAGFHGANGLTVLKAAAQGASEEGANLGTMANALTTVLNAYGMKATSATAVTNQMLAAVGQGKMTLEDFAGALAQVLPVAAANHISFSQVAGAMATMTAQGMSAEQAAQDLRNVVNSLSGSNATAANEMRALGLNANQVSTSIGKVGLTGTMQELSEAILKNTSGGSVLLGYMKEMSPAAQGLARQILAGSIGTQQLRQAVYSLNPEQAKLISLFETSATSATGLKQTYTQAMKEMTGGETGLNVALMLGGTHAKTFAANVKTVSAAAKGAGSNVNDWGKYQAQAGVQASEAAKAVVAMGDSLGLILLPAVNAILRPVTTLLTSIAKNKAEAIAFAVVVGGVLAGAVGTKAVHALTDMKKAMKDVADGVESAVKKIYGLVTSNDAAAASSKKAGDAATKAGADAKTAAKEEEAASEEAAAAADTAAAEQEADAGEVAAANETAAAESSGSWATSAGQMIASGAKWAAQSAVKAGQAAASYAVAAGQSVARWAAAGGQMIASAAAWVAQSVAKVAMVVASNVAGALSSAGAWIAANALMTAGIVLVVAAVALAVYEIVKHWKSIVHGVEEAWDDVYRAVSKAVSTVVSFVKSHWELLLAILLGPIAVAVLEIAKHWDTIRKDAEKFISAVLGDISRFAGDVLHWFERMFDDVVDTAARWYGDLISWVRRTFDDFLSREVSGLDNIVHWFGGLPHRIITALGDVDTMLLNAGERIIKGLIHGITNMVGDVGSTMSSVVGEIKNFLPFSPARKGPLSGAGAPVNSGRSIIRQMAEGLMAGTPDITRAMEHVAGAVNPRGGYGAYAGGAAAAAAGKLDITLIMGPGTLLKAMQAEVRTSGGDPNMFVRKVAFRS